MKTKPNLLQRALLGMVKAAGTWKPQTMGDLERWMDSMAGGMPSASGSYVSGDTAVNFAAFFSGVSQISQTIASCVLTLYKESSDFVKKSWKIHPVFNLLSRKANPFMSAFLWKERMQYHAITWGNGYSYIQRDNSFRPIGLWPLNPERMTPKIVESSEGPALVYVFKEKTGQERIYNQDEIFHLAGFGFDSIQGYSLIEIARETIGLGLSQQDFSERFIGNGTHVGGILSVKKPISPEAKTKLRDDMTKNHSGPGNTGKFMVIEADELAYTPLGMPLEDAQFLESRVFQITEIARILNISPYKLKDYSHATFSNIEHLGIEYATDTIRPWAERWEAAINMQLLTDSEAAKGFAEFDLTSIHRGDFKTQNEAYNSARNGGWMNADDIRYKQNMNPIEDPRVGKTYWMPKNMRDASKDEVVAAPPPPKTEEPETPEEGENEQE